MANYLEIARIFEDRVEGIQYYETREIGKVKSELLNILERERKQLLFLIGNPGCGKSVFLYHLPQFLPDGFKCIKFDTAFFEPVDFIKTLIKKQQETIESYSFEEMIKTAVDLYQDQKSIIAIDEAQLLSNDMIELIRILADSKAFWFLLAMHKHESHNILSKPQFRSRPHRVLEIKRLQKDEVRDILSKELIRVNEYDLADKFSKKLYKTIYKYSKGNFRDMKKILNRLFLLMDCAVKSDRKRFQKPGRCLITMAALDGGILGL